MYQTAHTVGANKPEISPENIKVIRYINVEVGIMEY